MKGILLFWISFIGTILAFSEEVIYDDSTEVTKSFYFVEIDSIEALNSIDFNENLNEHYTDEDFNYSEKSKIKKEQNQESSFSTDWFPRISASAFKSFFSFLYFLLKLVLIAAGLYLLYRLILYLKNRKPTKRLPSKKNKVNLDPYYVEDIHEIDFQKELEKAQLSGDHRLAIRWSFLWTLKIMDERKIILWKPKKTNQDYYQELKSPTYKTKFKTFIYVFDNTWFGKHHIPSDLYDNIMDDFLMFRKEIS